jgi:hypothetical protein
MTRWWLAGLALAALFACSTASEPGAEGVADVVGGAGGSGPGGAGGKNGDGTDKAPDAPAASPTDGVKNGDESDVDCGGLGTPKCDPGKKCVVPENCASHVCGLDGTCAAPSPTDGVKNGDETDIDCGGSAAPKCAAGASCAVHADCASDGCDYKGKCASAPSCTARHGGDTCGLGEVGEPGAQHESCCTSIPINRPAAKGGPYTLDKYVVTAGRMRAFIERLGGNVRARFMGTPNPQGWNDTWRTWLPSNMDEANWLVGPWADQRNGCQVANGTRTYWLPDAVNNGYGDRPHNYDKNTLDQKTMVCAPAVLFYAFCIWDGGKLASSDEVTYAVRGEDNRQYPWGAGPAPTPANRLGNYQGYGSYIFPLPVRDNSAYMNAPGRMLGRGQFGHADLLGPVLLDVRDGNMGLFYTGSVEGHGYTLTTSPNWGAQASGHKGAYHMTGARCTR